MNKAPSTLSLLLSIVLALAGAAVQAQDAPVGDAARGSTKVAICLGCHGIVRYQASFPEVYKVPKIAGQDARYLVAALTEYQKGERKHPTMRAVAGSLSAQDMADVGAYYEQLGKASVSPPPPTLATPMPDNLKSRLVVCVACHGANFSAPIAPTYPRLAGQYADYLAAALHAYQTDGKPLVGRANALMRGQLVQEVDGRRKLTFDDAEIKQIGQYLASLPGELRVVPEARFR